MLMGNMLPYFLRMHIPSRINEIAVLERPVMSIDLRMSRRRCRSRLSRSPSYSPPTTHRPRHVSPVPRRRPPSPSPGVSPPWTRSPVVEVSVSPPRSSASYSNYSQDDELTLKTLYCESCKVTLNDLESMLSPGD